MATATATAPAPSLSFVLRDIDWATYCQLRDNPANNRVRMDYLDGELHLMSPGLLHEEAAEVLGLVVRGLAAGHGLALMSLRTTTLRHGTEPKKGSGKEPDNAFYIGDHVRAMWSFKRRGVKEFDLAIEPPPDLAIEVDNSTDSVLALAIYARLDVPEVWIHDVNDDSVRFFRLDDGKYLAIPASVILPRVTPERVIRALAMYDEGEMDEFAYLIRLEAWARDLPEPPATT